MSFWKKKPKQEGTGTPAYDTGTEAFYTGDLWGSGPDSTGFSFVVDDVFAISGRGTVAVGTVTSGQVSLGDAIFLNGRPFMVDGIEMFRKFLDHAEKGDSVGLLLKGASRNDICKGDVLAGQ